MSKYEGLLIFLKAQTADSLSLTFDEINKVLPLNNGLPASAYTHPAWWENGANSHHHAHYWQDAGYLVKHVNQKDKFVIFTKKN